MLPSPDECTFHRQTVVSTRSQFIAPPVLAKWLQIAALLFFMCRRVLPHARTTVEMRNSRARNATSPAISSPNLASLNRLKELEKCEQLPRSATNVVNWNSATFASCAKNKEKKKLSLFGGGFTQKSRAHGNGGKKTLPGSMRVSCPVWFFFCFRKDLFAFLFVPFLVPKNSQCCDPNEEEDGCAKKNRRFACVCIHKFAFQSLMVVSFFGVNNLAN